MTNPVCSQFRDGDFPEASLSDPVRGRAAIEALRWPNGVYCPKCGFAEKCWPIIPRPVASRIVRAQTSAREGLWKCGFCRRQFTVTVGTVLEDAKLPLSCWLRAVTRLCAHPEGTTLADLAEDLCVSHRTAGSVLRRVLSARHRKPLISCWRRAIRARWRLRRQIDARERMALDTLKAVSNASATSARSVRIRNEPLTLWPLSPLEAMDSLLRIQTCRLL